MVDLISELLNCAFTSWLRGDGTHHFPNPGNFDGTLIGFWGNEPRRKAKAVRSFLARARPRRAMAELGVWYLPMQDAEDILSDEQRTPTSRAVQDDFNGSPLTLDVRGVQAHLTAALLSRPSVDELAERGIVRSPSACIAEQLGRKLARRPSREEVPQNILDSKVHQVAKQLSRRSLAAALRCPRREPIQGSATMNARYPFSR